MTTHTLEWKVINYTHKLSHYFILSKMEYWYVNDLFEYISINNAELN